MSGVLTRLVPAATLVVGVALGVYWASSPEPRADQAPSSQASNANVIPAPAVPTDAEAAAARDEALRLIDEAKPGGVWGFEHAVKIRLLMSRMRESQRLDAMNALSRAINGRQLKLEANPPF